MNQRAKRNLIAAALLAVLATPLAGQVKDHRDIKYPELPEQSVPRPEIHTLDNGLKIFLLEDHELPLINITGRIRTGSNYEPADKVGLASILGRVMREGGTTSMDGDAMDDFLESRAAFVETRMRGDFGTVSMNCLKQDFDDVLAVFADVLRNPAFTQDKIDLAKQRAKTSISRRNDQISRIAGREFARLLYGKDSPLGRLTEYATLAAITREDLVAWHRRYYHPNNIMLGITGDFDSKTMKRRIAAALGDWERGPDSGLPAIVVRDPEPGIHFIEKSDVTQAHIRMGHKGIRRDNPDYYAVQMLNEIFGGGSVSRLFSSIRTQKGLAYSVGGGVRSGYAREGFFALSMSTKSETMAASVDALHEEIDKLLAAPPTEEEFTRARESILNSFMFNFTSTGQILGQQLTYAYYGYPADFLERYRQGIEQVKREDIARVAKKYIHPDKLVTLVVGKAADFDRPLSDFGPPNIVDITIPAPESSAAKIARNAESLAAGASLLARSAGAINGTSGPARTVTADYTVALTMGGQTMSLGRTVSIEFPDKLRRMIKSPRGEQTILINGNRGVRIMGDRSQPVPERAVAEELSDLNRELLVLAAHHETVEAVAGETAEVDGQVCTVLSVSLNDVESTLCLDEDGRVLSQTYQGAHPLQRTPGELRVVYSDYRDVGGYSLPHLQILHFDGEVVATISTNAITVNPEFEESIFEIAD